MLALFDALKDWFASDGFRGCAFINGHAEAGSDAPAMTVMHKRALAARIEQQCEDAGLAGPGDVAADLLLVIEGAIVRAQMDGADAARGPAALLYGGNATGGVVNVITAKPVDRFTANIVGPVCETGDTFAMGREIDKVIAGDLAIFRTAGAYGATMASTYNSRSLVPEVLVDGDASTARGALRRVVTVVSDGYVMDADELRKAAG